MPDLRGWEWRYLRSQCRSDERATLTRPDAKHSGFIISVAYSPDGKWLASGSHDGRVKLFDLSARRQVAEFTHEKAVRAVAFSPGDSTLATLCADGFLRFWDIHARSNVAATSAWADPYSGALAFSRDGSLLAFSDARAGSVTISNLATQTFFAIHTGLTGLAFSPDATVLATRGWDDQIKLWEVQTGHLLHILSQASWGVSTIAFSLDGRQLVSTSIDQTVKLWDTGTGQLLHTQRSRVGNPTAALFLPDGETIAVANADYTITLWDVTDNPWKERAVLKGHRESVWALALSSDGTELASGSTDGEVKLWSTAPSPERIDWVRSPNGLNVFDVFFSTDARSVLLPLKNGTIELWDSATLSKMATLVWPDSDAGASALDSDGKTIASGGKDGTVKLWRVNGALLYEERRFKIGTNDISPLAFSPDGKMIAVSQGGMIVLCGRNRGETLHELTHDQVSRAKFSPNSTQFVSASLGGGVKLWEVATGRCLWTGKHERSAVDAAFFPDGRKIVSGAYEPKAKLWDAASGRELATLQSQLEGAISVAVSPDGRRVAVGTGEGTIKLFMFKETQPLEVMTLACQANQVNAVSFLPDGQTLVAATLGGLQVWRAPSFVELAANEKMENGK